MTLTAHGLGLQVGEEWEADAGEVPRAAGAPDLAITRSRARWDREGPWPSRLRYL